MSFLDRDKNNQIYICKQFMDMFDKAEDNDCRDSLLMDLLGEMKFDCDDTRWNSPILWTHIPSRKIVIAVNCPTNYDGWSKCPYTPKAPSVFAFICEQDYEIRLRKGDTQIFETKMIVKKEHKNIHWFNLAYHIRNVWEKSVSDHHHFH